VGFSKELNNNIAAQSCKRKTSPKYAKRPSAGHIVSSTVVADGHREKLDFDVPVAVG